MMPTSEAKIAANRQNALRSTGPRTAEGKARSRANGWKHGMSGEGVALPSEDAAEVERRYRALGEEFRPTCESGRLLVRRFAFLSVRLERCERFETKALSKKVRHAGAEFDEERLAVVEGLASKLDDEPMTSVRRLQGMPEGIAWLVGRWSDLKAALLIEEGSGWTAEHSSKIERLLGHPAGSFRTSRPRALAKALGGDFRGLNPSDGDGLDDGSRMRWARLALVTLIDAEVDRLEAVHDGLDFEAIEQDRAEAADRALFDLSPEMTLARKYESATERWMYKALKQFRELEARSVASESPEESVGPAEPVEDLASSWSEGGRDLPTAPARPVPANPFAAIPPSTPSSVHFPIVRGQEEGRGPLDYRELRP